MILYADAAWAEELSKLEMDTRVSRTENYPSYLYNIASFLHMVGMRLFLKHLGIKYNQV